MKAQIVILTLLVGLFGHSPLAQAQPPGASPASAEIDRDDYIIGVQDSVNVTVWENADLTGKFTVQPDGAITLPLVGRVKAAGLSLSGFEMQLTRALADGFLIEPRVAVTLDAHRGRRIFIFGAVSSPGAYALPEGQTLIEALVRAGYATASQVVVVRPKRPSAGPTLPENAGDAEVIRVNLKELEKDVEQGSLARNIPLQDGDTVFIPRSDPTRIFVTGQVRTPGAYSITENTSVLQAVALAGGVTESAAINRLRIMRHRRRQAENTEREDHRYRAAGRYARRSRKVFLMSPHVHGRQMSGGDPQPTPMDLFGAPQRETRPFVDWRNAVRIVRRRVWPAATVAVVVFVAAVVHALHPGARLRGEGANPDRSGPRQPGGAQGSARGRSLDGHRLPDPADDPAEPVAGAPDDAGARGLEPADRDEGGDAGRARLVRRRRRRRRGRRAERHVVAVEPSASGQPKTYREPDENGDETTKINDFLAGLRVTPVADTRLVDVYYTSPDAPVSAMYVNAIVTHFIQQNAEAKMTASQEVIEWLNARLVEQRKTLESSEAALHRYRSTHNIVSIGEQSSLSVQKLTEMTAAVTKAKTDRIEKEAMFKQLESVRATAPRSSRSRRCWRTRSSRNCGPS